MALLYIDGFDHYSNATGVGNKLYELDSVSWSTINPDSRSANDHAVTDTMPELGGRGLALHLKLGGGSQANQSLIRVLPESVGSGDTITVGFHFYMEEIPQHESNGGLLSFCTPVGQVRSLKVRPTGLISYWEGNMQVVGNPTGSEIVSTGYSLAPGVLYHLEFRTYVHASDGEIELRINGQTVFSDDGLDTLGSGFTHLGFAASRPTSGINNSGSDSNRWFYDNLYIYNDDPSDGVYEWLGERNVMTIPVASDESPQDWTLSGGTDAHDLLNQVPPDPNNDYIESTTAGDVSKFGIDTLDSADISVVGIQTTVQAYKTGTSDTDIDIGVDTGSDLDVNTVSLIQDQPTYFTSISTINPTTTDPYIASDVQSSLIHIERVL